MPKILLCIALVLLVSMLTVSYTHPSPAPTPRTLVVPPNTKVIGYVWVDEDVYILYRPMTADESPEDWNAPNLSIMSMDIPTVTLHESRLPKVLHFDANAMRE